MPVVLMQGKITLIPYCIILIIIALSSVPNQGDCTIITITATEELRKLPEIGFDIDFTETPHTDNAFVDSVALIRPNLVRFPGGIASAFWNWEKGWVDTTDLPDYLQHYKSIDANPCRLSGLKTFLTSIEAEPVIVLNCLRSDLI